jgi:hypothetical protein
MSDRRVFRYRGRRLPSGCIIERKDESIPGRGRWSRLSPLKSLRLRNHSPDGFEWGYGGSGPAQTALALLLDYTRDRGFALQLYQDFKFKVVAGLAEEWELTGDQISEAITRIREEKISRE